VAAFPIRIEEGRLFRPGKHEAIAGRGLLDWLGLEVGDEIAVHLQGEEGERISWQIVGRYPEPANRGQMLVVNLTTLEPLLPDASPHTYLLKLSPDYDAEALRQHLEPAEDADLSLTIVKQAIPSEVAYVQIAIFFLSVILIGIALINVFNTSLLAVQERVRVIGVLKTLGMTPGQVVAMVATSAGLLGLLAALAGIPAGVALTGRLLDMLSANYGFGTVEVALNPTWLVLLVPLIVGVSMGGSLLPGRRAARTLIVEVLRRE
jgi:putative ABC transport system permease protein